MQHLRKYSFQCHHVTWNGKSNRASRVAIPKVKFTREFALCRSMYYHCEVTSYDVINLILYVTCAIHVNLMGSHIVQAIFIPDLYYKLA